jgi:hypothetical protein
MEAMGVAVTKVVMKLNHSASQTFEKADLRIKN